MNDRHVIRNISPAGVAEIILNRPDKRNSISLEMFEALADTLLEMGDDSSIRACMITGAGNVFSSGADLDQMAKRKESERADADYVRFSSMAWEALRSFPKPLVAKINGPCFAAGLGIASKCDFRIAADTATFCIPATRIGLAYPLAHMSDLVALIGPVAAKKMVFRSAVIGAGDALSIGLADAVCAPANLDKCTLQMIEPLLNLAPLSLKASKASINSIAFGWPPTETAEALIRDCYKSSDHQEGIKAFKERRKPSFRGQ